jgi:hypothetical protein
VSHAAAAANTAAGTASTPTVPTRRAAKMSAENSRRVAAAIPAAAPIATAAGEDRAAAEATAEAYRVGQALGRHQHHDDPDRVLLHEVRDRGLAEELDVLRVGAEQVGERCEQTGREPAREQQRGHGPAPFAPALDPLRKPGHRHQQSRSRDPDGGAEHEVGDPVPS